MLTYCSTTVWCLAGKAFSRSSVLSSVDAVGELVESVGTLDAAAVVEKSCGFDVLLCRSSVELMMEQELFMHPSVCWVDSYSVGGWTSAYNAIWVSLHLWVEAESGIIKMNVYIRAKHQTRGLMRILLICQTVSVMILSTWHAHTKTLHISQTNWYL